MGNILLNLIEDCESKAPQCWEMAEKIIELEMNWDASCYLPVKKALELAGYLISDCKEAVIFASFMMVLAPWRLSKEVFAYTPELMELLCDQADLDIDIPTDILHKEFWMMEITDKVNEFETPHAFKSRGNVLFLEFITLGIYMFFWSWKVGDTLDRIHKSAGNK